MVKRIMSAGLLGLKAERVEVEASFGGGEMGLFSIVGLPDKAVSEARERVRSAISSIGLRFPKRKVVVNLAPADFKKYGPSYDLPIAVSIMSNVYNFNIKTDDSLFVGELALNGDLRPINGALSIVSFARDNKIKKIFLPKDNVQEACLVNSIEIYGIKNLKDLYEYFLLGREIKKENDRNYRYARKQSIFNFSDVKGQSQAKRALEVAVAGAHNILMSGPPGSGKTILAKSINSIMPDLNSEEIIDLTKIYSVAGKLEKNSIINYRPFRCPHHTASSSSIVGGGSWPRPGEISLAHRGVLFLDELPEFPRVVLENLRQPLEDGVVNICRAAGTLSYPANFMLVAAMNPCPCGYFGDKDKECICSQSQLDFYKKKISGPIKDRIDININVPRINFESLSSNNKKEETSEEISSRIDIARKIQEKRFKNMGIFFNSEMSSGLVEKFCPLNADGLAILKKAMEKLNLSARAYFKILKISRTLADLKQRAEISADDIAEALFYHSSY